MTVRANHCVGNYLQVAVDQIPKALAQYRLPSYFDDPLHADHTPLILGWSDRQLTAIATRLAPQLPGTVSDRLRLAVAAVARSIVAEEKVSGLGVYYARARSAYSSVDRYRVGDPHWSWYFVTKAIDLLASMGLITHRTGRWAPQGRGRRSVAWATDELMRGVGPLVDVAERRELEHENETIVLRAHGDKAVVDYRDTAMTVAMRDQVARVNRCLARLEVRHLGRGIEIPLGRRIFNGSFQRGGRFYFHGSSPQNMRARDRLDLEIVIDGAVRPVVEVDYASLHLAMAYAEAGEEVPAGDLYALEGFHRSVVKVAVNILFNAKDRASALCAIASALRDDAALRATSGLASVQVEPCRSFTERLVLAVEARHQRVARYFASDCGVRFQRWDSDIALEVMDRMIHAVGRCPVPVHDSFLVADVDAPILEGVMREVAHEHGLGVTLKRSQHDPVAVEEPGGTRTVSYSAVGIDHRIGRTDCASKALPAGENCPHERPRPHSLSLWGKQVMNPGKCPAGGLGKRADWLVQNSGSSTNWIAASVSTGATRGLSHAGEPESDRNLTGALATNASRGEKDPSSRSKTPHRAFGSEPP